MLEEMRKNSRSTVIYVLFAILITVFIVSFGPQSDGTSGCGSGGRPSVAAKVGKREISEGSFRYGYILAGGAQGSLESQRAQRVRETVMDKLIERELYAQAAADAGFKLSTEEVETRVGKGEVYFLGARSDVGFLFQSGALDYQALLSMSKSLGFTNVAGFINEQKQEMLAQKFRELLASGVRVSPDEVLTSYQRRHTSVSVQYARFESGSYAKDLKLSEAEVSAWATANDKELKERWERDKNLYAAPGKWVHVRRIFFKSEKPAAPPPAEPAPTDGAAPAEPAKPAEVALPDPARAKAEAALARLKGGADFATLARELSQEERTAKRGGLGEWVLSTSLGYADPAGKADGTGISKTVETLEVGKLSEVLETSRGFLIVKVEERLDAGPSFEQVKTDLAWEAAHTDKAKQLAKADAEAALAAAKAGTPLEELFAKAGGEEAAPTGEAPAGEGEAAKAKPPAAPVAKPRFDKVKLATAAKIRRAGKRINGEGPDGYIGESAELVKAIFDQIAVGQVGPEVYETDTGFVVVKVTEKEEPDMAAFEKEKADLASALAAGKADGVLREWKQSRCLGLRNAGEISVTSLFVEYGEVDEKGQAKKSNYQPCAVAARPGLPPGLELPPGMELPEGFTFE
jgi:peptidyl-prolyl cis-trans isomerase D